MRFNVLAIRRTAPAADRCEHCGASTARVWLVPGDVLNSCRACFHAATGCWPVHGLGYSSTPERPTSRPSAGAFYIRPDGRRPRAS